jgi:regulatory protein
MKITGLTQQQRDPNRVNVMVDGKYRFSLDVFQIGDLGIKVGKEYSDTELINLETESQFGRLYGRALEYCLMRPHSSREVRDYLYRKTLNKKIKNRRTGELKNRPGVSKEVANRVFDRLVDKGYVDDEKFTRFWVENRNQRKGTSIRKLQAELMAKGVDRTIIEKYVTESDRNDSDELHKVLSKKRNKYSDDQKLIQYLVRQGFNYDDIKTALLDVDNN